jgi:thioester reductase-like protein
MKAVLTGASGFIGGGAFEQCIDHPKITSIVCLCRRPLPELAARNAKVTVLIVEDFTKYSGSILDAIKNADICIW